MTSLQDCQRASWQTCSPENSLDKAPGIKLGVKRWKELRVPACDFWQINWEYLFPILVIGNLVRKHGGVT
jgi:hypothetical protein